jgi:hypothetical protein
LPDISVKKAKVIPTEINKCDKKPNRNFTFAP